MFHHFGRHGRFRSPRPGCGESSPGLEAGGRHGRGGFGRFGFGGEFGMGPESFRGRKMGSVDLRLVLLTLLAERPSHGYELIKSLEERSGGFYSPSPGMVYPALTWLEEVGYARGHHRGCQEALRDHRGRPRVPEAAPGGGRCDPEPARAHRAPPRAHARGLLRLRGGGRHRATPMMCGRRGANSRTRCARRAAPLPRNGHASPPCWRGRRRRSAAATDTGALIRS